MNKVLIFYYDIYSNGDIMLWVINDMDNIVSIL